jgi:hypothetical protein
VTLADKIDRLTKKDRMLIDIILIGSTKLIAKVIYSESQRQASASYNLQIKPQVLNSVLTNLSEFVEQKRSFRPADIRSMLPSETKNIQSSDLTRILDFFVDVNILERVSQKSSAKKKRLPGHPFKYNDTNVRLSGPDSRYRPSRFYYNLIHVLHKPEVLTWIHTLMLESGLLYKYRKEIQLFIYDTMRSRKYDRESAWKVCKSTFPLSSGEQTDFYKHYPAIREIRVSEELIALAEKKALASLTKYSADDYVKIYMLGGFYYKLHSE